MYRSVSETEARPGEWNTRYPSIDQWQRRTYQDSRERSEGSSVSPLHRSESNVRLRHWNIANRKRTRKLSVNISINSENAMLSCKKVSVLKRGLNSICSLLLAKWNDNWRSPMVKFVCVCVSLRCSLLPISGTIREKERELITAIQSQHQVNNGLFNGHPHSYGSTSSGHSSPTHQLIDTNNNPTTTTTTTPMFYPPAAVTPPPLSNNAASNLDPNAQDFCLLNNN